MWMIINSYLLGPYKMPLFNYPTYRKDISYRPCYYTMGRVNLWLDLLLFPNRKGGIWKTERPAWWLEHSRDRIGSRYTRGRGQGIQTGLAVQGSDFGSNSDVMGAVRETFPRSLKGIFPKKKSWESCTICTINPHVLTARILQLTPTIDSPICSITWVSPFTI